MTLAEIRTAVRTLIKEESSETGALFPVDNVKLDFMINTACQLVIMDLVHFMGDSVVQSELLSLVASTAAYTMTGTPLRFFGIYKNVTDERPYPIRQYEVFAVPARMMVGETATDPVGWFLTGEKTINFFPTPSTSRSNYAKIYFIPQETLTMAEAGPAYIPASCHRLIPIKAAVIVGRMNDQSVDGWEKIYSEFLSAVRLIYLARNQGQPRELFPDFNSLSVYGGDSRDKAFHDLWDPLS